MIRNHKNKEDLFIRTVERYIHNKATPEEVKAVIRWFTDKKYQFSTNHALFCNWQKMSKDDPDMDLHADLTPVLDRLHHKMNLAEDDRKYRALKFRRFSKIWMSVASILMIPLLIISGLYLHNINSGNNIQLADIEISVPPGSRIRTQLPDGSFVWLNGGSVLTYPADFSRNNRLVNLTGEAFFDIRKDEKHPFIVNSGELNFRVLGTTFNLMAYPDENELVLTLESGQLSVESKNKIAREKPYCLLGPDEQLIYDKKGLSLQKYRVETEKFTSWKEGRLIFRNDPLLVVLKRLERWYNVEIEVVDPTMELPLHPFTLTVEDETVTQVLEYLSIASSISWKKQIPHQPKNGQIRLPRYLVSKRKP